MLTLEVRKPYSNNREMQLHETQGIHHFTMRSRLPCRGHCLHPGTALFKYGCLSGGRGAAELLPRHTPGEKTPHGDSDFIQVRNGS